MNKNKINIADFKRNSDFYKEISLILTVKSFDLQAIRKRYLKSKNNKSKRTGSVERRKVTEGGVISLNIKKGNIIKQDILNKLPEPRGIDGHTGIIALSSENKVFVIKDSKVYTITNPWFSYIHTTKINPADKNKVLISSSGFDCIFEYDYIKNEKTFEWFSWENGFNKGLDPESGKDLYLTRSRETAKEFDNEGKNHLFISNPEEEVLPTSKRAAFINSVSYSNKDKNKILATFFHEGAVYQIDTKTNKAEKVLDDLTNPHGGCNYKSEFMATSTKSGELVFGNTENQDRFDFSKIEGKAKELGDFEWIQNSIVVNENIISIDSNRNCFVIFNPEEKLYDLIAFDKNWAVQDLIDTEISESIADKVKKLK